MSSPRASLLQAGLSSMELNRSWSHAYGGPASPLAPDNHTSLSPTHDRQHIRPNNHGYNTNSGLHTPNVTVNTSLDHASPTTYNNHAPPLMTHNVTSDPTRNKFCPDAEHTCETINEESHGNQKRANQNQVVFPQESDPAEEVNWNALLYEMAIDAQRRGDRTNNKAKIDNAFYKKFSIPDKFRKPVITQSNKRGTSFSLMNKARNKFPRKEGPKKIDDVYDVTIELLYVQMMRNEQFFDLLTSMYKMLKREGGRQIKYKEVQTVQIRIVFTCVQDIDTLSQQFQADVHIQARWQEKQFAGKTEKDLAKVEFQHCWNPEFVILNLEGGVACEHASMIIRYEPEHTYPVVTYMWHISGIFREALELEHFPLDCQELSIALTSNRPSSEIELVEDYFNVSSLSARAFKSGMWDPYSHVTFVRDFRMSQGLGAKRHPVLISSCHCRRRIGYYMWNIFMVVFLIFLLSLIVLAIDPTGTDRVGILLTLFLTTVAFKLVVQNSLPKISYLTYLDMYIVFLMIYLALQAFVDALWCHLGKYRSKEKIIYYDEIVQSLLVTMMILGHLAFVVWIQTTAMARRRDLFKRDFEHQMGMNRKQGFARQNKNEGGFESELNEPTRTKSKTAGVRKASAFEVETRKSTTADLAKRKPSVGFRKASAYEVGTEDNTPNTPSEMVLVGGQLKRKSSLDNKVKNRLSARGVSSRRETHGLERGLEERRSRSARASLLDLSDVSEEEEEAFGKTRSVPGVVSGDRSSGSSSSSPTLFNPKLDSNEDNDETSDVSDDTQNVGSSDGEV